MAWDPVGFTATLKKTLATFDVPSATKQCEDLIAHLVGSDEPYPPMEAERVLQALRNKRMFTPMRRVGDALIHTGRATHKVRRQFAQSLIDEGNLSGALSVLEELSVRAADDSVEGPESRGLIGRVHKQLFVNSGRPDLARNREHLRRAVGAYLDVFTADPVQYTWHGINVVALLVRARRDGVSIDGFPDPLLLARSILERIRDLDGDAKADMWSFATAMEACIALGDHENALVWLARYVEAPYADAFEVASTLRQLTEVWQLESGSAPGGLLLPMLRAKLLSCEGGGIAISRDMLIEDARAAVANGKHYEKVLGPDSFQTYQWYLKGAQRCRLVCRIGRDAVSKADGTGFLVKGSALCAAWEDEWLLLTNAHVVSDDPEVVKARNALRPEEAVIVFEALGDEEYSVAKLLWTSDPGKLDATVLRLENVSMFVAKLKDDDLKVAKVLPALEETARVYIIGHPGGGRLSISLQDNALLDHEDPLLHYRTPTAGGSSGSPLFNRQWDLIGLHHAGGLELQRLNKKSGTYAANEGIWIRAIMAAIG